MWLIGRGAEGVDDRRKLYSLWDTYPHADLVTYPSLIEGFGNALLETIYFRLPALVNRSAVYTADIGPLGFQFAEIEGVIADETNTAGSSLVRKSGLNRAIVATTTAWPKNISLIRP